MSFIQLALLSVVIGFSSGFSLVEEEARGMYLKPCSLPPDTLYVDSMVFSNYFSPNGDGINDLFIIKNVHLYPNNQLSIYNRLGELVFFASPYTNDWDGRMNQKGEFLRKEVSDGIYLFDFLSGTGQRASGKITVKR